MKNKKIIWGLVLAGVIIAIIFAATKNSGPGKYDAFATCLGKSGTNFYGAFWCPHCQNQKKLFGTSAKLLPYVECSTPDGQGMLQVCKDKGIEGFPTWIFVDGSRLSGETPLATLAQKTNCPLPQ